MLFSLINIFARLTRKKRFDNTKTGNCPGLSSDPARPLAVSLVRARSLQRSSEGGRARYFSQFQHLLFRPRKHQSKRPRANFSSVFVFRPQQPHFEEVRPAGAVQACTEVTRGRNERAADSNPSSTFSFLRPHYCCGGPQINILEVALFSDFGKKPMLL